MNKLISGLILFSCLKCFGGSLPLERQFSFFGQLPIVTAPSGWGLLTSIKTNSADGGNSCSTPAIDTTGASLIVIVQAGYNGVNPVPAPTSSPANTWNLGVVSSTSGFTQNAIYWATNLSTSVSQTFSTSGGALTFPAMVVLVFTNGSGIWDKTNSNAAAGSQSTIQVGSVTPSTDGQLIIAGSSFNTGSTATIDSSFSTPIVSPYTSGNALGAAGSYKVQSIAGAVNPTFTFGGSSGVCGTIMTFKQ